MFVGSFVRWTVDAFELGLGDGPVVLFGHGTLPVAIRPIKTDPRPTGTRILLLSAFVDSIREPDPHVLGTITVFPLHGTPLALCPSRA